MSNFFNSDDVIIVIDDDVCPGKKELMFADLPQNKVSAIAQKLEYVEDEYKEKTLEDIINDLGGEENFKVYFSSDLVVPFNDLKCLKFHPLELSANNIKKEIEKYADNRIFIILDRYLDDNGNDNLLKGYLKEINCIMNEKPIALLLYSNNSYDIKSLEDAKKFLESMQLDESEIELLSMHINFIDKVKKAEEGKFEEVFRKSQNANLLNLYKESYEETMLALKSRIWNINNNESLIHYDYLMEGMHIDDIFYRIYEKKFDFIYNKKCVEKYQDYINPVRKSIQVYETANNESDSIQESSNKIFISRLVKEFNEYLKSDGVRLECKKSDDINFGDLIEIDNKIYLVISQSCDTVVRKDKYREFDTINLIRVEKEENKLSANFLNKEIKNIGKRMGINSDKVNLFKNNREMFTRLGFSDTDIEAIVNKNSEHIINDKIIESVKILNSDKRIYSISDIWLDSLILRCDSEKEVIEISSDIITKSNELRFPTKEYLLKRLDSYIKKYESINKETLVEIGENKMICDLLNIKPLFDEHKLAGFIIQNKIKRIGKLEYIKALELFDKFIKKYSRFSYNNLPLI